MHSPRPTPPSPCLVGSQEVTSAGSTYHRVAQEEDWEPGVVFLQEIHMLEHIPDKNVEVGHHHPLPFALSMAHWKGTETREPHSEYGQGRPPGLTRSSGSHAAVTAAVCWGPDHQLI